MNARSLGVTLRASPLLARTNDAREAPENTACDRNQGADAGRTKMRRHRYQSNAEAHRRANPRALGRAPNEPLDFVLLAAALRSRTAAGERTRPGTRIPEQSGPRRELREPTQPKEPVVFERWIVSDADPAAPPTSTRVGRLPPRRPAVLAVGRVEAREGFGGGHRAPENTNPDSEIV